MSIPGFSANGTLPPFSGADPADPKRRSPYQTTLEELISRFCTSAERATLLRGLNRYREHLYKGGFVQGYQWIDGSFVEDVEKTRNRAPADIDVVTFFHRPLRYQTNASEWSVDYQRKLHLEFFDTRRIKPIFSCDSYSLDLDAGVRGAVRNSNYWLGLFSAIRGSSEQKGIIEIDLPLDPMEFSMVDSLIDGWENA